MPALTRFEKPRNLRETVLDKIRSAIVTGELAEGELVTAPRLGRQLGVSATPVREAMMDLAREGLVETVKNKGFRVTTMSEKELDDLASIRLLLEPPMMEIVAFRITGEDCERLLTIADACLAGAEEGDLPRYLSQDRDFHAAVLAVADNPQLTELATSLRTRTRLYGIAELAREGTLPASAKEHHELIDLLRAGDGVGARDLLSRHISHARDSWATGEEGTVPASL